MKTLIYSPYVDWRILELFKAFAASIDPHAEFLLKGNSSLQENLIALQTKYFKKATEASTCFTADGVVGDSASRELFRSFKERNNFSLDIPLPPESKNQRVILLTAAAFMNLLVTWMEYYEAREREYTIPGEETFDGRPQWVRGFRLDNVQIAQAKVGEHLVPVKGVLDLGDGFTMELCDLDAFEGDWRFIHKKLGSLDALVSLKEKQSCLSAYSGSVISPSIKETFTVKNHLAGIVMENTADEKLVERLVIDSSELLGKFEISEKGVSARVEVVASAHVLITACVDMSDPMPVLTIQHGLVAKIFFMNELLFTAYVPQEKFLQPTVVSHAVY